DVDTDERCLTFCDQPHVFSPLSRALTCATCPGALNNGLFIRWQLPICKSVPDCPPGGHSCPCATPACKLHAEAELKGSSPDGRNARPRAARRARPLLYLRPYVQPRPPAGPEADTSIPARP